MRRDEVRLADEGPVAPDAPPSPAPPPAPPLAATLALDLVIFVPVAAAAAIAAVSFIVVVVVGACALCRVVRRVARWFFAGGLEGFLALLLLVSPPALLFLFVIVVDGGGAAVAGASCLCRAHASSPARAALNAFTTASSVWLGRRSSEVPGARHVGHSVLNSNVRRMHSEQSGCDCFFLRTEAKRNRCGGGEPWFHAHRGGGGRGELGRKVKGFLRCVEVGGSGERSGAGIVRCRCPALCELIKMNFNSQVWVHVARLHGMVKRSPHIAQRSDSSSFCCSTSGHASGSSSSRSHAPSNISGAYEQDALMMRRGGRVLWCVSFANLILF